MTRLRIFPATMLGAAALAMTASPVLAADLGVSAEQPAPMAPVAADGWQADAVNADQWGYPYGGYGYRHRRNRVDAGDVLAGVLIIGGIAAIASAASKSNNQRRYPREDVRYRDSSQRYDRRGSDSGGIEGAARMCVSEIERDVRVDGVDRIERNGNGWTVTGRLYDGRGFNCMIGNDGRVQSVDFAGGYRASAVTTDVQDRQWSDDRYADAWEQADRQASSQTGYPEYPGGPVDGEYAEPAPYPG